MASHQKFIDIVHKLGQKGYPLKDVYRRIQDRELFLIAYGKLYANEGAMTLGTDPEDTIDGMSVKKIDTIIEKLHQGNYQWKPVKRVYVPKSDGRKRPISIPSWNDKLLQEVIRMVLEAYYEPKFSEYSHSFRPHRGCHTALREIHHTWKGTRWFIEGDIKGCFDNLSHNVILDILARDIKDNRFLKLIRTMLKAGYVEDWKYHETLSGAPQGGVVSPIISNIVLNELDKFVENELIPKYNIGKRRKRNLEYYHVYDKIRKARQEENQKSVKELTKELRKLPEGNPHDPGFRRLRYNRYADDFLLGLIGPREEAEQIKEEIKRFLKTINLEMSEEKTLITHALTGKARYLGYNVAITKDNGRLNRRGKDRQRKKVTRSINYIITLTVPKDVQKEWRQKYFRHEKPIHRPDLLEASDFEIVTNYGQEFRGIVNYYSLAFNVSHAFYPVKYAFIQSAAMTLANKHKTKVSDILKKYKRKSNKGLVALIVENPNPNNPNKPYRAQLGEQPIKTNLNQAVVDEVYKPFLSKNELTQRLTANVCELCNSTQNIEVHHIRKIADLKKRYKGRNEPPKWVKEMIQRNRKTLVICSNCHDKIHAGTYDGKRVN